MKTIVARVKHRLCTINASAQTQSLKLTVFSFGEKSKQKRTLPLSNRYSRNIDLTVRLIYANTNLLLSTAVGRYVFCSCCRGRCPHRPAVLTLPTIVGGGINQVYGYDSAEGFHFLLVQKTKQKSTLKTYGLKNPLMPTHSQ